MTARAERILILAPAGRDAAIAAAILAEAGLASVPVADFSALLTLLSEGAGAAVVTEEALRAPGLAQLCAWIERQPPWSDFPFIVLVRQGGGPERNPEALRLMELLGNVTFLERPFHPMTFVSIVRMTLRGRRRQYDARERLAELREARRIAEASDRAKSRFLAAASHDLRQPLQSMFLFSGLLEKAALGKQERRAADNIASALNTLRMLLDALLDVSKLDAGTIDPDIRDVPIQELLDDLKREYADRAAGKKLSLCVVGSTALVRTDRVLLGRILRNLVENAMRYTQVGTILVGCRRRQGRLQVQVIDTGPGIPEDRQQEIFEEFTQIGNPHRDTQQGLGLGLAIVRRLSQLLDHPVTLQSTEGKGARFAVDLPLART